MNTMILTESQFIDFLATIKGCNFVNVETSKEQGMLKRGNPFYGRMVEKHTTCVMQFNYSYERAVNNRLEKQGDDRSFNTGHLPFGHWVSGLENKVIEHNGKFYVRLYEAHNPKHREYSIDGRPMSAQELKEATPFFKKDSQFSSKQAGEGLVNNQVQPKLEKLSSIVSITINDTKVVINR